MNKYKGDTKQSMAGYEKNNLPMGARVGITEGGTVEVE